MSGGVGGWMGGGIGGGIGGGEPDGGEGGGGETAQDPQVRGQVAMKCWVLHFFI